MNEIHPDMPEEEAQPEPEPRRRIQIPQLDPYVTYTFMGISILFFLIQLSTQSFLNLDLPAAYGVKSNRLIRMGQYWRLLTPVLLHGSLLHLGFNMYALYILGRRLERYFGHGRFLALYVLGGFCGNIFSFLLTEANSLGSSTAIFGLLGAEGVFLYQNRELLGDRFRQAISQIIQVAVINLLIGLSPGIDNWGHIGGLLGGVAFTWLAGPIFQVEGISPLLQLKDQRSTSTVTLVFVLIAFILSAVAAWALRAG